MRMFQSNMLSSIRLQIIWPRNKYLYLPSLGNRQIDSKVIWLQSVINGSTSSYHRTSIRCKGISAWKIWTKERQSLKRHSTINSLVANISSINLQTPLTWLDNSPLSLTIASFQKPRHTICPTIIPKILTKVNP